MSDSLHELGLNEGATTRDVRRAYAAKLKQIDPEKDPSAFLRLRQIYEDALFYAEYSIAYEPVSQSEEEQEEQPKPEPESAPQGAGLDPGPREERESPGFANLYVEPPVPMRSETEIAAPPDVPIPGPSEEVLPGPDPWQREIKLEVERIYDVFVQKPADGPVEMKRFAMRWRRETLEQSEFAEDEWIDRLYETSERWEAGERLAKRTFVWLLEACEKNFQWEYLATAPTVRQMRINGLPQMLRRMRAPQEKKTSDETGFPWRYVFFGIFILSVILRACPLDKKRSDSPRFTSVGVEQAVSSVESQYSTNGFTVYTAPVVLLKIPGARADVQVRPLEDTNRFLLSAYAAFAFPETAEEAKLVTDQGSLVFVSKSGRVGEVSGRRLARLLMHDPATHTYFFALEP